jgi:hypothetical protein
VGFLELFDCLGVTCLNYSTNEINSGIATRVVDVLLLVIVAAGSGSVIGNCGCCDSAGSGNLYNDLMVPQALNTVVFENVVTVANGRNGQFNSVRHNKARVKVNDRWQSPSIVAVIVIAVFLQVGYNCSPHHGRHRRRLKLCHESIMLWFVSQYSLK